MIKMSYCDHNFSLWDIVFDNEHLFRWCAAFCSDKILEGKGLDGQIKNLVEEYDKWKRTYETPNRKPFL